MPPTTNGHLHPFWDTKQCVWSCPVMPTTAPDTCTHTSADATNFDKVKMCSGISNMKVCQEDKCFWNLPEPVQPSKNPETCTHVATDSQNTKRIGECSTYKDDQSCVKAGCVYNPMAPVKPSTAENVCTHFATDI